MKFTVTADCTPAEARAFLGLPDLEPLHQLYVSRTEEWLRGRGVADLVRGFGAFGGMPGLAATAPSSGGASAPGATGADPAAIIETLVRRWAPLGEAGMGMMQSMLAQMAGAAMAGSASPSSSASGSHPPREPGTPGTPGGGAPVRDGSDEVAAHPS